MQEYYTFAVDAGLTFSSASSSTVLYAVLRFAENMKLILGGSILPLVYGVLGSAVYILRQLFVNRSIFERQLTPAGIVLRLGLGGVSGLAIGWFWTPSAAQGVSEISNLSTAPFAIAFLAGYSIDLLFSILDRIIEAINPKATPGNAKQDTPGPGDAQSGGATA